MRLLSIPSDGAGDGLPISPDDPATWAHDDMILLLDGLRVVGIAAVDPHTIPLIFGIGPPPPFAFVRRFTFAPARRHSGPDLGWKPIRSPVGHCPGSWLPSGRGRARRDRHSAAAAEKREGRAGAIQPGDGLGQSMGARLSGGFPAFLDRAPVLGRDIP